MQFFSGSIGFWLIVMIVMLILEAMIPGLLTIWFAAGALAALLVSLCHASFGVQVVVFLFVKIAALVFTRPLVKKYVNSHAEATNADRIIGRECIVKETIDNVAATGAVGIDGAVWTARSEAADTVLPEGSRVRIVRIEGVKAIVRPIE